jgi:hypothetical protein
MSYAIKNGGGALSCAKGKGCNENTNVINDVIG